MTDVTINVGADGVANIDIGQSTEAATITVGTIDTTGLAAVPISIDEGNMLEQHENGIYGTTKLTTQDW